MFYVITNQGLLQPAPGMEGYCVSKCLPVPENGMNIELFVVNYSGIGFTKVPVFYCLMKKFKSLNFYQIFFCRDFQQISMSLVKIGQDWSKYSENLVI